MSNRAEFNADRLGQNYSSPLYDGKTNSQLRFAVYDLAEPPVNMEEEIVNALSLRGGETIVDVGTASGNFLFDIRVGKNNDNHTPHVGPLYGFEPYTVQLPSGWKAALAEQMGITFANGSATEIPLPDNTADVLTALFMMYHVPPNSQQAAMDEFIRVLKPEGKFVLSTSGSETIGGITIANKQHLRSLESAMATILGVTPPPYMNDGYDTNNAMVELPKHFENVAHYKQRSPLVACTVLDLEVILKSFRSLYDQYEPPLDPNSDDVTKAEKKVFTGVCEEFIKKGGWTDWVVRDCFIGCNGPLTLPSPEKFSFISKSRKLGSAAVNL